MVEPLVAGRRQALRHTVHHAAPHLLSSQVSNLGSGNRLHIGCDSFLHPKMAVRDGWKTEVNHFMRQLPVILEIGECRMLTHRDPASRPRFAEANPVRNAPARRKQNRDPGMGYGEPAEVGGGGARGLRHPIQQGGSIEIELV